MIGAGTRLGQYEVQSRLGSGGMGEVYRARDAKLGRDVAIKVLPAEFATDPDRRSRLEREARLLASLNHPHIATIHGVDDAAGVYALVMELVEGPTLQARLGARDLGLGRPQPLDPSLQPQRALPLDEALAIARQIADALDAAHERGIVHRDLKPANIKLTSDGTVKVLDFGLATAAAPPEGDLSRSPTMNPTRIGTVVGTAAYMSPEQARGLAVDKRTDIWAFGCVLYEMLTGRQAFTGATNSDVMAHVLEREPDWSALPAAVPPRVNQLLRRCLEKDPKHRLRDIGDARLELTRDPEIDGAHIQKSVVLQRSRTREWAAVLVAVTAVTLAAAMGIAWYRSRAPIPAVPVLRFEVPPPTGSRFESDVERTYLSLSPDGSQLAFVARTGSNGSQVWLRPLSALEARPVAGTEGARSVFWAPDSRSFAFFAGSKLKRADTSRGSVVSVCDAPEGIGLSGTWGGDGQILFASVEGAAIFHVSTAGGTPVPEIKRNISRGEARIHWPWFLPDGKRFLYVARLKDGSGQIMLAEPAKAPRPLVSSVYNPQWLDPDILIFVRDGTLVGQRIDLLQTRAVGEPFSIAGPIDHSFSTGRAMFTASPTGVLAYQSHTDLDRLVWVDRAGQALGAVGADGGHQSMRLSPDRRTALFERVDPPTGTPDVWTLDLDRRVETRLTSDPGSEAWPVWMPGGRGVVFMADRGGASAPVPEGYDDRSRRPTAAAGAPPATARRLRGGRHSFYRAGRTRQLRRPCAPRGRSLSVRPVQLAVR